MGQKQNIHLQLGDGTSKTAEKKNLRVPKKMDQKHLQSKGQWSAFGSGRSAPAVVF